MAEDSQSQKAPESTDARFTIRALFIVMTLAAVAAAVMGVAVDQFPAEARPRVIAYWGICALSIVVCVAVQFWRRRRAEKLAGPVLLRVAVKRESGIAHWLLSYVMAPLGVLLLLFLGAAEVTSSSGTDGAVERILLLAFPFIVGVGAVAHFAPAALWQHEIKFCEEGILWDQRVLPWDELIEYRWTGSGMHKLELFDIDSPPNKPWVQIPLAVERKAEIDALLAKMAPQMPLAWARARRVGIGQVPISTVYRTRHLLRHLGHVLAGVLCGAGLCLLAFMRKTGMREFDEALHVGFMSFLWRFFDGDGSEETLVPWLFDCLQEAIGSG